MNYNVKKIALAVERFSRFAGGAEVYAVMLSETLIQNGWEVHVYAESWDGEPQGVIFHPLIIPKFLPTFLQLLIFAFQHRRKVRKVDFHVVVGFGNTIFMNVYQSHGGVHWFSSVRKIASVSSSAGRFLKYWTTRISPKHLVRHWIESAPFRITPRPKITAISEMIQNDMVEYYGIAREEIEVVYNGVNTEKFKGTQDAQKRKELRQRFKISQKDIVFLFVSYELKKKGIKPLVEATGMLKAAGKKDFKVMAVGGLPYASLNRCIKHLGVQDSILFTGPSRNMAECYAAADVFVLPTYYDACSLVVFEAMACGLPAITTISNGAAGIIENGKDGFVISHPPDAVELSQKMALLLDIDVHASMSEEAAKKARNYSLRRNHARMMKIFEDIN
jgi:UDP-glucose:(heptosyl)LPS alpha-1,3-glucosyltransferase